MYSPVPAGRRGPSGRASTAAIVIFWILLVIAALFAVGAFIVSLVNVDREDADECIPLYGPGATLAHGCYYFAQSITCTVAGGVCFTVDDSVWLDLRGQSLHVTANDTTAFEVGSSSFIVSNGLVYTDGPANAVTSIAFNISSSTNVRLEKVTIANFYRPVNFVYSSGLTIEDCEVSGANQINWDDFNNCAVYILGSNATAIRRSFFYDNNVRGVLPQDYRQYASHGIQTSSVDGFPSIGLVVEDSQFVDTRIRNTAFSFTAQISDITISGCTFEITDPLYDPSAIEIGDTDTVWNGTNQVDLGVVPITAVTIEDCTITNLHAHPAYDGILVKMATGLRISRVTIIAGNNGFAPSDGNIVSAHIHLGIGMSGIDYDEIDPWGVQGAVIEDCVLVGRPNVSDASNDRMGIGILVEAGSSSILISGNTIGGIGAGMPANPHVTGQCADGPYPAQVAAGIWVTAGASGVQIVGNSISDGSCANGAATVAADGIVVSGAITRASFCDTGVTKSFPPADQVFVSTNDVSNVCGKGIQNDGTHTSVVYNHLYYNPNGNYAGAASPTPQFIAPGAPLVGGWNLAS